MGADGLDSDTILGELQDHITEIQEFGVVRIGLFGSYIHEQSHEGSDIDFLVAFEEGATTFDNYMGLKLFLEDLFDHDVDLVVETDLKPELQHVTDEAQYVATA